MMKKLLLVVLGLLALAAPARAGEPVVSSYDVTSTSYIYCSTTDPRPGVGFLKTTGSSTTVTAVGTATPFANVAVLDEITVVTGPDVTPVIRYVTARASSTSITISGSAIDWSNGGNGYQFTWRHVACGTSAADGWMTVSPGAWKTLQVIIGTLNAASIEVSVEGRIDGVAAVPTPILNPISYTAASSEFLSIPEAVNAIRVGWKVTTDAGVQSVSALLEEGEGR